MLIHKAVALASLKNERSYLASFATYPRFSGWFVVFARSDLAGYLFQLHIECISFNYGHQLTEHPTLAP